MAKTVDLGRPDGTKHPSESKQQSIRKFFPKIQLDKVPDELFGKDVGHAGTAVINYRITGKEMFTFEFGEKSIMVLQIEDIRFNQ